MKGFNETLTCLYVFLANFYIVFPNNFYVL